MSTFLELCNKLHFETRQTGANLTAVTGLTGKYYQSIPTLIANAWEELQGLHTDWQFLRQPATPTVAANDSTVDIDAWVSTNLSTNIDVVHKDTFSIYKTATGISDETPLEFVEWEDWKARFGITINDGDTNRPEFVSIDPDTRVLVIGPISDAAYTLHFEFNAIPTVLAAATDEPNILSHLQPIIVWRALEWYGEREEDKVAADRGKKNYRKLLRRLEARYLPKVTIGGPLA